MLLFINLVAVNEPLELCSTLCRYCLNKEKRERVSESEETDKKEAHMQHKYLQPFCLKLLCFIIQGS